MKKRKGVTLLELVIVLALFSIIISIGTSMFIFGNKAHMVSAIEADMQAKTRLTAEYIKNITRFATKTHTIPRSSFQHSENDVRDPNTSYIGITKDGHVVIDEPGSDSETRKVQYIAKKQEGIDYEIIFDKVLDDDGNVLDKSLTFSIVAKREGKIINELISQLEVLNSIGVEYLGTTTDPAVALAFSMVEPGSQEWIEISPDAYITLVLDKSGSMAWDMNGIQNSTNQKRDEILKEKALKMIDRLSALDFNIYVSIIPFGNNANNPMVFRNLNIPSEKAIVVDYLRKFEAKNENTNTGDGIRRAYYQLKNKADQLRASGKEYSDFTQHMMVLVDGGTNRETRTSSSSTNLYMNNGNINNSDWIKTPRTTYEVVIGTEWRWVWDRWNGYVYREFDVTQTAYDNRYVKKIGDDLIKPYKYEFEGEQKQAINSFVIGFSNRPADYVSLDDIGDAVNGKMFEHSGGLKPYILAADADELDFAFEQFEAEVENSLWVITRPQLWP